MGKVIRFSGRHARVPATTGLKKASIWTSPPEKSLNRLASPRDASFRPAKMLRKCESEKPTASASCATVIPLESAQRTMGCDSVMPLIISARNAECQPEIFLSGMTLPIKGLVKCAMAKRNPIEPREIFLGEWLKRRGIGPTEAARIAGCTQSYISNISSGARANVNALFLLRLSEHLEININDFFRKPPTEAQIASIKALSPEAQDALLRPKRQKRG